MVLFAGDLSTSLAGNHGSALAVENWSAIRRT
jgi:hypothetical protein